MLLASLAVLGFAFGAPLEVFFVVLLVAIIDEALEADGVDNGDGG